MAALGCLSLAVGAPGHAAARFSYSETISGTGELVVTFDEGGLKKLGGTDYRLDATVTAIWSCNGGPQQVGARYSATATTLGLLPDDKGHANGTATLPVDATVAGSCATSALLSIDYQSVTLTNTTTGHAYRLDPLGRTFP